MYYQTMSDYVVYGPETLEDVETAGKTQAQEAGAHIDFFQS